MDWVDHMDHMDAVMLKSPFCPSGPSGPLNADAWQKTKIQAGNQYEFLSQTVEEATKSEHSV